MGTASLVIGSTLVLFGFVIIAGMFFSTQPTMEEWYDANLGALIIGIPVIIGGALFLRKYDGDKKKEKFENS